MSWCWNDPVRVSLKSFISLPLSSEVWLHRMLSCGNTLQWDRHSEGLQDMLRSSAWGFGFLSSSWWARWTQPAETESSECLITYLAGAEATETVRAEQISLERFPGMKSMKAEIIPPFSRVVEKAGLEFLLSPYARGQTWQEVLSCMEWPCFLLLRCLCWSQCQDGPASSCYAIN